MKISLSFHELSPDQAAHILAAASGKAVAEISAAATVQNPAPSAPAPVAQIIPPMPQNVNNDDYEDDDETAPATGGNMPELDADGLPWDERIHGTKKTKNADGRWRKRKGAENVEAVEAELKAKFAGGGSGQASAAPVMQMPQQAAPQYQQPATVMQMPQQAAPQYQQPAPQNPQPAAPVMQMPQQAVPAPAPTGQIDGQGLMQHLTQKMSQMGNDGKPIVTFDYLTTLTAEIGNAFQVPLSAITDILNNPQQVAYAVQCIQRDGKW